MEDHRSGPFRPRVPRTALITLATTSGIDTGAVSKVIRVVSSP